QATGLSGDLQRLAAEVSLLNQDYAHAPEMARRVVSDQSRDYRDHIWLGQILWSAGRTTEAEPALRRATALAAERPEPWMVLVQFLAATGRKAEAEATITK